jgi:hypothetical protein
MQREKRIRGGDDKLTTMFQVTPHVPYESAWIIDVLDQLPGNNDIKRAAKVGSHCIAHDDVITALPQFDGFRFE